MFLFEMIKKNRYNHQRERGQSIVLIAMSMLALIAAIGLATDATLIYKTKQDLQRAIDAAALAAAYKLPNQDVANQAAYEFTRLHGYNFDPSSNPLQISFPVYNPPRKAVSVSGSTQAEFTFLRFLGFTTMTVSAEGEGESAPLDVYLVLDLSQSMVYDTSRPANWPVGAVGGCSNWDNTDCKARYCNLNRVCDPLDVRIKPAAKYFVDQFDSRYDRVGVVVYHQYGTKVIGLSNDFTAVKAAIDGLNAFDHQEGPASACPNTNPAGCNKNTNIGDGIMVAHQEIGIEGRLDAIWSMVLLTDGKANVYRSCSGCPPSCGAVACQTLRLCNECSAAEDWALNNARDTWNRHEIVIYTIAYGSEFTANPSYKDLLIDIADWTDNGVYNGGTTENFWQAPGASQLRAALLEIAQRIYGRLIR